MKTLLNSLIYSIHIAVVLMMLVSAYSWYIPPDMVQYAGMAGLLFPLLLVINILFGIYWLIRLKLKVLLTVFSIALVLPQFKAIFQNFLRNEDVYESDTITFTSYNVRLFNHWHWVDADVITEIPRLIDSLGTDILGIQEYYKGNPTPDFPQFKYHYIVTDFDTKDFGMAIFSKYPIIKKEFIKFDSESDTQREGFIYADLDTRLGKIRVICAHLVSFRLTNEDLNLIEKPDIGDHPENLKNNYVNLFKKINHAFEKRASQVRVLKNFISESPYPVVLLADLNDTPVSYTYKVLSQHLRDPFVQVGTGIGHTYQRTLYPFRIDYVLHSGHFSAVSYSVVHKPILSDHYPVTAKLKLNSLVQ